MTFHKGKNSNVSVTGLALAVPLSRRASINEIISRVSVATPESQIAVFKKPAFGMDASNLVAVFASTVRTMQIINRMKRTRNTSFVGLFDRTIHGAIVRAQLNQADNGV